MSEANDLRRALGSLARPPRALCQHRGANRRRDRDASNMALLALQWPVRLDVNADATTTSGLPNTKVCDGTWLNYHALSRNQNRNKLIR
ncbi:unnamed protein product [Leptidea sinapis]|uniref:Uncharacterized protein n=1 Tax=Leptidea sinapis TaxID=189913 RepID=A0A5E4PRB2_9NEOP|nr:unnamed protein product [Leptidea sinapis]